MSRRKEPSIPNELLDQLLAGGAASAVFDQGGLLDTLKKAFTERALNAEMDHHLGHEDQTDNNRNGYGRKTVTATSPSSRPGAPREQPSRPWSLLRTTAGRSRTASKPLRTSSALITTRPDPGMAGTVMYRSSCSRSR